VKLKKSDDTKDNEDVPDTWDDDEKLFDENIKDSTEDIKIDSETPVEEEPNIETKLSNKEIQKIREEKQRQAKEEMNKKKGRKSY